LQPVFPHYLVLNTLRNNTKTKGSQNAQHSSVKDLFFPKANSDQDFPSLQTEDLALIRYEKNKYVRKETHSNYSLNSMPKDNCICLKTEDAIKRMWYNTTQYVATNNILIDILNIIVGFLSNVGGSSIRFDHAQVNTSLDKNVSRSSPSTAPRITNDLEIIFKIVFRVQEILCYPIELFTQYLTVFKVP
jgi:hypothetical protein